MLLYAQALLVGRQRNSLPAVTNRLRGKRAERGAVEPAGYAYISAASTTDFVCQTEFPCQTTNTRMCPGHEICTDLMPQLREAAPVFIDCGHEGRTVPFVRGDASPVRDIEHSLSQRSRTDRSRGRPLPVLSHQPWRGRRTPGENTGESYTFWQAD